MNKRKLATYAFLPALGLVGILGAGVASANGFLGGFGGFGSLTPDQVAERQLKMFQTEAQVLGLSVDEIKQAWAEGTSPKDLMTEKGIKPEDVQARMKDLRMQDLKTQLQTLADKGVITQAQADKRLQTMQDRAQNANGKGLKRMGMMGRRMHGRGFWGR